MGNFAATIEDGKIFENNLKIMVDEIAGFNNSAVFIWNDKGNNTDLTSHTVTMIQFVGAKYGGIKVSDWLMDSIDGNLNNYGMKLFE